MWRFLSPNGRGGCDTGNGPYDVLQRACLQFCAAARQQAKEVLLPRYVSAGVRLESVAGGGMRGRRAVRT
jgi:hypothetical protein